jgi:hypothetical protein
MRQYKRFQQQQQHWRMYLYAAGTQRVVFGASGLECSHDE